MKFTQSFFMLSALVCAATATPTWAQSASALTFVPVSPCRVVDTRFTPGFPYIRGGSTREVVVPSSSCNIPAGVQAYSVNVTVVPHGVLNYLTVWPSGGTKPVVSTLNSDGRVKANAAIVQAGPDGGVNVYATNDTDLILDINGYFVLATSNSGLDFYPLTPCRVADTRILGYGVDGYMGSPALAAGLGRGFPISQACGLLSMSAQAYALNFTVVPTGIVGFLAAWPYGLNQPVVSTLNVSKPTVVANAAIVQAGTGGTIGVYSSDKTDLVIDVSGYFATPLDSGLKFYALQPCRAWDTRFDGTGQPVNGTSAITIAGTCGVPNTAAAVVVNATVLPLSPLGFLALWQDGASEPIASTLNAEDSAVTSNMAIIPLGNNGQIDAHASSATHLILDVSGYFAP